MSRLTDRQIQIAQRLYEEFWSEHPDIKNPSDINCQEKANFLMKHGYKMIALMQKARKASLPFTRRAK